MGIKPAFLHLTVVVDRVQYVLGTLSFSSARKELSYHFTYPYDSPSQRLNCDTGKYTAKFEHITWHKNIVHIKRADKEAVERVNSNHNILFHEKSIIPPVYVESLYFKDNVPCLLEFNKFKPWQGSAIQEVLNLETSAGFSVVYLIVPSTMDLPSVLVGAQFKDTPDGLQSPPCIFDLCDEKHKPGRILVWENRDVLVIPTRYKCRIKSEVPKVLEEGYRLPNYRNTQSALSDLVLQANGL